MLTDNQVYFCKLNTYDLSFWLQITACSPRMNMVLPSGERSRVENFFCHDSDESVILRVERTIWCDDQMLIFGKSFQVALCGFCSSWRAVGETRWYRPQDDAMGTKQDVSWRDSVRGLWPTVYSRRQSFRSCDDGAVQLLPTMAAAFSIFISVVGIFNHRLSEILRSDQKLTANIYGSSDTPVHIFKDAPIVFWVHLVKRREIDLFKYQWTKLSARRAKIYLMKSFIFSVK